MLDSKMFVKLKPLDISGLTIGGVDGGFFSKLLIGLDIFVFRAIAVFSTFDREGIVKTTYYPSRTPQLEVALSDIGLSSIEFEGLGLLFCVECSAVTLSKRGWMCVCFYCLLYLFLFWPVRIVALNLWMNPV